MDPIRAVNSALALAGMPFQNGTQRLAQTAGPGGFLSQVSPMGVFQGVALAGGGIFALQSIPGANKVSKISLGMLGGGLLLAGVYSVYDALT